MKNLSEKFVLLILLLQPCLVVPEQVNISELRFGDILTFPRCHGFYEHYAIFVDDETIDGRNEGTNIFEMTKNPSGCRFGTVTGTVNRNNYLDSQELPPQEKADIIAAIHELMNGKCGSWKLTNNCEHIATYVRYGEAYSQCNQKGTPVATFCPLFFNRRQRRSKESVNLHQGEPAAAA